MNIVAYGRVGKVHSVRRLWGVAWGSGQAVREHVGSDYAVFGRIEALSCSDPGLVTRVVSGIPGAQYYGIVSL